MTVANPTNPYERFMDPDDRRRIFSALIQSFGDSLGSAEFDEVHSAMLERLAGMAVEEVEAIENPATWMYVGMRNLLRNRLRDTHGQARTFAALSESDTELVESSGTDDVVLGSLVGREAVAEELARVAELVWLKFDGQNGQIAARALIDGQGPDQIAAELGLDYADVRAITHKAHQEQRLLEKALKANPEFRCWRLRKHMTAYYETGEVSLALRAHWVYCAKCGSARRLVEEHTYAALAPLLPVAAAPAGVLCFLHHAARHATHPLRALRRAVRPAAQLGGKSAAGSTQVSGVAGVVGTKAAAITVAAVVAAGGAATGAVAIAHHFAHHKPVAPPPVVTRPVVASPVTTPATTPTHTATVVHHTTKPKAKPKPKHRHKPTHKRRVRKVAHTATTTVAAAPPVTTTVAAAPPTTTSTPPAPTTAATPPPATTTTASNTATSGHLSNPSYQTPSAP